MAERCLPYHFGAMNAKNTKSWLWVAGPVLLALSGWCLEQGTRAQTRVLTLPAAISQPLPPRLNRLSLIAGLGGMRTVGADATYIDALQYIGNSVYEENGHYPKTFSMYREVLWIDPYFHFAVLEGAAFLGWNVQRLSEAQDLLEAAMRVDPAFGRYKLYYAALAYQKVDSDPNRVLDVLRGEVRRPDAPDMLLRIVGNLYMKYHDWEGAKIYWSGVLVRTQNLETRMWALRQLKTLAALRPLK